MQLDQALDICIANIRTDHHFQNCNWFSALTSSYGKFASSIKIKW